MGREQKRDVLYLVLVTLMAVTALGSLVLGQFVESEWVRIRPASVVLAIVVACGLLMRGRRHGRTWVLVTGVIVIAACGFQLATFVIRGHPMGAADPATASASAQSLAAGLFCIGSALALDALLPARWGRHLLFGLLGAVSATIGAAGVFAAVANLSTELDASLLDGMRLPGSSILLLSGLTLLIGARLRSPATLDSVDLPFGTEEVSDRSGLAAALTVLFVTLGATLLVWRQVQNQYERHLATSRNEAMQRFSAAFSTSALNAVTLLSGIRGLFAASRQVDEDEWLQYFSQLPLAEQYPGVFVVGYSADVEDPHTAESGDRVARVDRADMRIWPASGNSLTYPTVYILPRAEATQPLLGMDLGAIPLFASTVDAAGRSDKAAFSGRVDFEKFHDPASRVGYIVVMPLARHALPDGRERTAAVGESGFVFCFIDAARIIARAVVESHTEGMALKIVDDAAISAGLPVFQSPSYDPAKPSVSRRVDLGGRKWSISAQLGPGALLAMKTRNSHAVLAGGLIAALAMFVVAWILTGNRARALHLAAQINRELGRAQKAQQAVTDTAVAGIITADSNGDILYMNPSAARGFGVDADAMVGSSLTVLMPERFREAHSKGLARVASDGNLRLANNAMELAGLRADGSEFPIELLRSAWKSDDKMYFTAFVNDITDRKLAEQELKKRAQELERSNADLEQFAYVASHDLQEPLRMVASYVQLLARRYHGKLDSDADEFIGYAVDGATRMQNLIEDLLAYARVGRSGVVPVPTNVGACAQAATAQLRESIAGSGAKVLINANCSVLAVPAQLTQVFQNLIANALKFRGPDAPAVSVDAQREGANWHICVADNGIGIEPKHWERVFAIFQRLHTRSEYSGTGIGLAICRRIVESFGGSIWVESKPGSGSVFHFILPGSGKAA